MDESLAREAAEAAKHEVAAKEEAAMAAGVWEDLKRSPPRFALKRTLPLGEHLHEAKAAKAAEADPIKKQAHESSATTHDEAASRPEPIRKEAKLQITIMVKEEVEDSASACPTPECEEVPEPREPEVPVPPSATMPEETCPKASQPSLCILPPRAEDEKPEPVHMPRPALLDAAKVVSPAEQNSLAQKIKRKKKKTPESEESAAAEDEEEKTKTNKRKKQATPKGKAAKAKATAKTKAKSKAAAKTKAKSSSKAKPKNAKPKTKAGKKRPAQEQDEASSDTKHYSPAKSKRKTSKPKAKAAAKKDLTQEQLAYKAKLSRKSSAYHKAKLAALKEGKSKEAATKAAKKAPWPASLLRASVLVYVCVCVHVYTSVCRYLRLPQRLMRSRTEMVYGSYWGPGKLPFGWW